MNFWIIENEIRTDRIVVNSDITTALSVASKRNKNVVTLEVYEGETPLMFSNCVLTLKHIKKYCNV